MALRESLLLEKKHAQIGREAKPNEPKNAKLKERGRDRAKQRKVM